LDCLLYQQAPANRNQQSTMKQLTNTEHCPICAEGFGFLKKEIETFEYLGFSTDLELYHRVCNVCTSDYESASESKVNNEIIVAWKSKIDKELNDVTTSIKTTKNKH
jgi:hypothetical protein